MVLAVRTSSGGAETPFTFADLPAVFDQILGLLEPQTQNLAHGLDGANLLIRRRGFQETPDLRLLKVAATDGRGSDEPGQLSAELAHRTGELTPLGVGGIELVPCLLFLRPLDCQLLRRRSEDRLELFHRIELALDLHALLSALVWMGIRGICGSNQSLDCPDRPTNRSDQVLQLLADVVETLLLQESQTSVMGPGRFVLSGIAQLLLGEHDIDCHLLASQKILDFGSKTIRQASDEAEGGALNGTNFFAAFASGDGIEGSTGGGVGSQLLRSEVAAVIVADEGADGKDLFVAILGVPHHLEKPRGFQAPLLHLGDRGNDGSFHLGSVGLLVLGRGDQLLLGLRHLDDGSRVLLNRVGSQGEGNSVVFGNHGGDSFSPFWFPPPSGWEMPFQVGRKSYWLSPSTLEPCSS